MQVWALGQNSHGQNDDFPRETDEQLRIAGILAAMDSCALGLQATPLMDLEALSQDAVPGGWMNEAIAEKIYPK
jgi:hypothetical protein